MISPEDIKLQALKWWKPFLQSCITNEPFFPKQIDRIGKIKAAQVTQRFESIQQEMDALYKNSKNEKGIGYQINTSGKNFRRTGKHELPESIAFTTADDFLYFTGKRKEWKLFTGNYALIIQQLPLLESWILDNVNLLTLPETEWDDVLKVCHYFILNPRPELYLRQLPIKIHTKFIEENAELLQSLIDFLIPDHIRSYHQNKFAERYFLMRDEPLIRLRILDEKLAPDNMITDLSIRLSDFEKIAWDCENVLIAENKMNFLTLPYFRSGIAIWSGGGFNVSYIKNAGWLKWKKIYYWGDIDEHGFQILHQIRSYYIQTKSIMMDKQTFEMFKDFAVSGERTKADKFQFLNEDENEMLCFLKSEEIKNRLEQEKIPQWYVDAALNKIMVNGQS